MSVSQEIYKINYEDAEVTLYPSGDCIRVCKYFGPEGEQESWSGATFIVAGPCSDGLWHVFEVDPTFPSKKEAVSWAIENIFDSHIYIHSKDGRIENRIHRPPNLTVN